MSHNLSLFHSQIRKHVQKLKQPKREPNITSILRNCKCFNSIEMCSFFKAKPLPFHVNLYVASFVKIGKCALFLFNHADNPLCPLLIWENNLIPLNFMR